MDPRFIAMAAERAKIEVIETKINDNLNYIKKLRDTLKDVDAELSFDEINDYNDAISAKERNVIIDNKCMRLEILGITNNALKNIFRI